MLLADIAVLKGTVEMEGFSIAFRPRFTVCTHLTVRNHLLTYATTLRPEKDALIRARSIMHTAAIRATLLHYRFGVFRLLRHRSTSHKNAPGPN